MNFLFFHSSNSLVNTAGFKINKIFKEGTGKSLMIIPQGSLPDIVTSLI